MFPILQVFWNSRGSTQSLAEHLVDLLREDLAKYTMAEELATNEEDIATAPL